MTCSAVFSLILCVSNKVNMRADFGLLKLTEIYVKEDVKCSQF